MRNERGETLSSWLAQLLLVPAVFGLIGHDLLRVAIASLALDGDAEPVADVAATRRSRWRL